MSRIVDAAVAAVAGAGASVVRQVQQRLDMDSGGDEPRSRWRSVTINAGLDQVMPGGQLPAPLAELGDLVEVEALPAPGDKGTELRARLRTPEPSGLASVQAKVTGDDPRQQVRTALRQAKQLIEVGEILLVDPRPHGHRPPTPGGMLVEFATKRAGGEGVL